MKINSLKNILDRKKIYFIVFFLPAILMFLVYAAFKVFPFGDNSVLVLDLNGQYVYYYEAFRDAFFGDGSLLYSWSRNFSGEFIGIIAYYLASPFSIIILLFPRAMITEALLIMQLCKIGACGVTFAYYLKNSKKAKTLNIIAFSTLYALMAYAVVQLMDPMWIDGLVFLPLIIIGVERLVDDKKKIGYIIPLALMFIANFYIGWMVGFFTFIYFVFYLIFLKKDEGFDLINTLETIIRFALTTIVAVMCSAFLILPTYFSLSLGKLSFTQPEYTLFAQFDIFDFFTKLLPQTYDSVQNVGLPFIYCGILSLFMMPLFFLNKNIDTKKKIGNLLIMVAVFLSMYLSTVDLAWHGFQVPNWLPYRYSFVFSFIMLVMASSAFERLEGISFKEISFSFVGILGFIIYVESLNLEYVTSEKTIWFSILCLVGCFVILYLYKKFESPNAIGTILVVLICCELFGNSIDTLRKIDKEVLYSKYSSYNTYVEQGREVMSEINKLDDSLFRTEKTFHRTVNDPMAFGMKGISHSSSTLNSSAINFLDIFGYTSRGHYTKYNGGTLLSDSLFGIKYIMTKDKPVYDCERLTEMYFDSGISVYENPFALSIGFMVDEKILELSGLEKDNPFITQNEVLNAMLGTSDIEYLKRIYPEDINYENVLVSYTGDHTRYYPETTEQNSHVEFMLRPPTDDTLYMFLPTNYEREVNIWLNREEFLGTYFEGENYCIMPIGEFSAGEQISLITTITKDETYMIDQWFYYLDMDEFTKAIDELKANQLNITKHTDTYIEGTVNSSGTSDILYLSIPNEPGWTIKIDGEKVDSFSLLDTFIGIKVPEGEHTITMSFFPKGMIVGIIISCIGVLLIALIVIVDKRKKKILLYRLYD